MNEVLIKVSVIIPIYNAEKYLKKCITSVLNQSYSNIEIILVNDCSTDNSLHICEQFKNIYKAKIAIISKNKNEGVDKARFTGLEHVFKSNPLGYVMFLDSDDWIHRHALCKLMEEVSVSSADVVCMQLFRHIAFFNFKMRSFAPVGRYLKKELRDDWFKSFFGIAGLPTYQCGKVYRISVIRGAHLKPSSYRMCEDHVFNMNLFPYISSWSIIDFYGYYYRWGGVTSRFNPLCPNLLEQNRYKRDFAEANGQYEKFKKYLDVEIKNIFYSDVLQRLQYQTDEEFNIWLEMTLEDSIWGELKNYESYDEEMKAILNKNKAAIIEYSYRRRRPRIKGIIMWILSYINKLER